MKNIIVVLIILIGTKLSIAESLEEKGFNIAKYKPSVISIEYLDLNMKKLEFKNNDVNSLLNSDLYKYFIQNNYFFVNWLHGDLIFVHKEYRD